MTRRVDDLALDRVVDGHLQVLGGDAVGDGDGLVEVGGDDAAAVRAERRAGRGGPGVGEIVELSAELGVDGVAERFVGREQHDGRIGAVLRLDQQVGGEAHRIGSGIGDHHALGRPEEHQRRDAVTLHLDLGEGHGRRSGADDHAHPGDRLRAEAHRRDARRAVDAEHLGDPELATDDEHGGVDRPVAAPGNRRDDEHDLADPGDRRRCRQLVGDARIAGLAGRHEQTDRGDRGQLLADDEAGLGFETPVGEPGELVLAEGADVGDRIVDRFVDLWGDRGRVDLLGGDAELARRDRHAVEAGQRVTDGGIAALAYVVDQPSDRRPQLRIEDRVESSSEERLAVRVVRVGPPPHPHHVHDVASHRVRR